MFNYKLRQGRTVTHHNAFELIHQRRISEEVVNRGEYVCTLSRRVRAGVPTPAHQLRCKHTCVT